MAIHYLYYRCSACQFGGKTEFSEDEDDLAKIMAKACLAIAVHAKGRKRHMQMRVKIDCLPGSYVLEVNPPEQWKGESARKAGL